MYADGFGRIGSLPADTKLVELKSPDRIPSASAFEVIGRKKDLVMILEVKDDHGRRIGAVVVRSTGNRDTGRLDTHGVSLFTEDEIQGKADLKIR